MTGDLIVDYRTQITSAQYGFGGQVLGKLKEGQTYTFIACGYCSQEQLAGYGQLMISMYSSNQSKQCELYFNSTTPVVKQGTFVPNPSNLDT
jgi:hypothetical protein